MAARSTSRNRRRAVTTLIERPERCLSYAAGRVLARSPVEKLVPLGTRRRLQRVILLDGRSSAIEDLARRLRLGEGYGITSEMLQEYTKLVTQFARPILTSHLAASIMSCMPGTYQRHIVRGTEVLLLSRLVSALEGPDDKQKALRTPDLVKLAAAMTNVLRLMGRHPRAVQRPKKPADAATQSAQTVSRSVRTAVESLYGINWAAVTGQAQQAMDTAPHPDVE